MRNADDYHQFGETVRDTCNRARSGTLVIRTGDNHVSMMLFDKGHIVGAYYGALRGRKALAKLRTADVLTYHFDEGNPHPVSQDLPSTAQTLGELSSGRIETALPLSAAPAAAPTARTETTSMAIGVGHVISEILTHAFAKFIGPAAHGVIGEAERTALDTATRSEMNEIIANLSAEYLEPAEQQKVAYDVNSRINRLFDKEGLDMIAAQVIESLGPLGRSVWQRVLGDFVGPIQDPWGIGQLVASLVEAIDDPVEAQEFIARVRRGLESLAA
jgi:hypothetical protein